MRAVVMEIDNDDVTVLTKDGRFRKINKPNNHIEVGMEINIGESNINFRRIAAIIVIVFLISGFGVSAYAYYTPYGYINVDINPSIEIIYNRFNRILEINGMNEDGISVVDNISNYKNKKVETILGDIIAVSTLDNNDEVNVLLTFDKLEEETIDNVKQSIDEDKNVNVYTVEIHQDAYQQAKSNNESPGKAALIDEVKKVDPSYNKEKLQERTINELIEIIEDKTKIENKPNNKSKVKKLNSKAKNKRKDKKRKTETDKVNKRTDKIHKEKIKKDINERVNDKNKNNSRDDGKSNNDDRKNRVDIKEENRKKKNDEENDTKEKDIKEREKKDKTITNKDKRDNHNGNIKNKNIKNYK
ncbi:anti-sigma-I factor RsgI [Vallitalea sediminicola]